MPRAVVALGSAAVLSSAAAFAGVPRLETVVEAEAPLTKRILFLVDVSGSMQGGKLARATSAVVDILEQPVDEVEFGVIAFSGETYRWPGKPEPDASRPVPEGWAALPSRDAVDEAEAWIAELGAGGDTLVGPALRQALREERDPLSVVLVTDGFFHREHPDDVLEDLRRGQERRVECDHGRAVVLAYGIGPEVGVLRRVGREGAGGFFRELPPEDEGEGTASTVR